MKTSCHVLKGSIITRSHGMLEVVSAVVSLVMVHESGSSEG